MHTITLKYTNLQSMSHPIIPPTASESSSLAINFEARSHHQRLVWQSRPADSSSRPLTPTMTSQRISIISTQQRRLSPHCARELHTPTAASAAAQRLPAALFPQRESLLLRRLVNSVSQGPPNGAKSPRPDKGREIGPRCQTGVVPTLLTANKGLPISAVSRCIMRAGSSSSVPLSLSLGRRGRFVTMD